MAPRNRILLNGDSCTFFYNPEVLQPEGGPYSARAVHNLVGKVADAGVDTFVINPSTQRAWYPSRKLPGITEGYRRGDREHFRAHASCERIPADKMDGYLDNGVRFLNLYLDLAEAGIDWLRETSVACRARGLAPWFSIRMNDTHGANSPDGSYFNCPLFRDPAMRVNKHALNPADPAAPRREGLDYLKREVREYMLSVIREPLEDYDFEGLELDWMRDPICVAPPASAADTRVITDFILGIGELTKARGRAIGRPYPLGLRAPGDLNLLRDIGIDVRTLVKEGALDFFGPTNFWQTSWDMPFDGLRRELGEGIRLLGVVEGGPNWLKCRSSAVKADGTYLDRNLGYRTMQYNPDHIRGNAAGKLVLGADGIEFFNCFFGWDRRVSRDSAYEAIRGVGDLGTLRGKRKAYAFSTQFWHPLGTIPVERIEQFPCILEPDTRRAFRLPMAREPEGMKATVQVVLDKTDPLPDLGTAFNGGWPTFRRTESGSLLSEGRDYDSVLEEQTILRFDFPSERILEGWNEITVFNNGHIRDADMPVPERLKLAARIRSIEIVVQ